MMEGNQHTIDRHLDGTRSKAIYLHFTSRNLILSVRALPQTAFCRQILKSRVYYVCSTFSSSLFQQSDIASPQTPGRSRRYQIDHNSLFAHLLLLVTQGDDEATPIVDNQFGVGAAVALVLAVPQLEHPACVSFGAGKSTWRGSAKVCRYQEGEMD